MDVYDMVIIGGGAAGYSCAMYAGRLRLRTLLLEEKEGGSLGLTNEIANWPGEKSIGGMELALKLKDHAREFGAEIYQEIVKDVSKDADGTFKLTTNYGSEYHGKTVVFATGTTPRGLGVPGEKELATKGVHICALCDGPFYQGKTVAVVGGGDAAVKEALLLTQWAGKVYIIVRKDKLRAEPHNQEKMDGNPKIEVLYGQNLTRIDGNGHVESVELERPFNGSGTLKLNAVFMEIGRDPTSELAGKLGVRLNAKKEIIIDREAKTSVPGVFAAGDVTDNQYKQAITSAGEGVAAALSAYRFLGG
ncbi:MAG: NAD(P)/FAD-dependent oxidoreductase [Candidatus Bilamarchaeaceae archaeon]